MDILVHDAFDYGGFSGVVETPGGWLGWGRGLWWMVGGLWTWDLQHEDAELFVSGAGFAEDAEHGEG